MADLIVDSEEYFAAREAADLLARVRAECIIQIGWWGNEDGGETECLAITGPESTRRELAEALKPQVTP